MEAELTLVFIETDVIDVNQILDDLVMLCFAEWLDLMGQWLLIKWWDLNDEDMGQKFKLPNELDGFSELLEMGGSEITNKLILASFRGQVLDFKGFRYLWHCSLDTAHDLQLMLAFISLSTLQNVHFFFVIYLNLLL